MKMYKKILASVAALLLPLSLAVTAYAATPTLSLSNVNGDVVQVTVNNADPNMSVSLYFNVGSANGMQVTTLGNTNSSGYFTSNVSSASYGVTAGSMVYVAVNGQQSTLATWPYTTNNGSAPSLSQTNLSLTVGQTSTITSYSNGTTLYISNNSNPSVATFSVNNTQINVTANAVGSTNATVCYSGNTSNCTTVYVTVQGSSGSQLVFFSQNNVSLTSGQTTFVTASGGSNGNYYVSANTNSAAVQSSISGSQITLYGTGTAGSATITVCTDGSTCGTLYVTNGSSNNTGSVTFSPTSVSMTSGQNQSVTIYGNGNYTMSNNTNANVVSTSLSGNMLTLYAIATGSSNITICQSGTSQCGVLYVTVNGGSSGNGSITFSQTNPSLSIGQTTTIALYGGSGSFYLSSNTSGGVTSASISGNTLTVTGINTGTSSLNVCSSTGGCSTLYVTVGNGNTSGTLSLSQSNLTLAMGQSTTAFISGGNGNNSYYISGAQNTSIASVSLSGSTLTISGVNAGNTSVMVCQNSGQCATLYITVTASTNNNAATIASLIAQISALQTQLAILQGTTGGSGSTGGTVTGYIFNNPIKLGDSGTDVIELQKRLAAEGYFSASITGYFGPVTLTAVKRFQAANGLSPIGSVGPGTRMALNS